VEATLNLPNDDSLTHLLVTVAGGGAGYVQSPEFPNPGGSSGGGTVGEFGTYGSGGAGTVDNQASGATGGGLSAISNGTNKSAGEGMDLSDVIIVAGGGGGGGNDGNTDATPGGDAGDNGNAAGGKGAATKEDIGAAGGGSDGAGGAAGTLDNSSGRGNAGKAGKDFDGSTWGAGGGVASNSYSSSGGAGYGGGGSSAPTINASSAAGGSYANANYATNEQFTPASNGGAAATDGGDGSVQLTFYAAPSVTTVAASSVGNSSATIEAAVNAQGLDTSALSLKYATDEATVAAGEGTAASVSPAQVTGSSDTTVTADVSGLSPGTTYYYRASATNSDGTTHGSTLSFTTTSPDPAPAPSGGGSAPAPAAPQPAPASTEPASVPSRPNTSTPTPSQSPLPPANPASSQVISRSVTLVGVETATRAQPRAMLNTPGQRIGKAPRVRATAGEPVKLIVQEGLEASERYEVLIKRRGGSYNELATVETDPAGAVQLPVVQFERTGTFVVAIRSSDSIAYVKLRVRG
jgi:hypothetical protein